MEKTMQVQAGGKLYLAGEYAVLVPGQSAIIKNIPIYMTASVKVAPEIVIQSDMFDYQAGLEPDRHYAIIQQTILHFADFLQKRAADLPAFSLAISGKMERQGVKFGIGSSGSVVILTIKALAAFYHLDLSADTVFKLAAYTLLKKGDNGSMGDVACIAYDDLVYFTSFDRQQVKSWIKNESLQSVLQKDWGYCIEPIKSALNVDFLVGWTKEAALSSEMIRLVQGAINPYFLTRTQEQVQELKRAFLKGDKTKVKEALTAVSRLLQDLHPAIYSDKLLLLKQAAHGLDAAAKSSGSGGGDCGLALSFSPEATKILSERWQAAGIELLLLEHVRTNDESKR
ncbi:phosphomevalonate kinase [Streptococcus pantholopis]|nr:phosphomevalonate kinase [Streptococcus pantholopis]